MLRWPSSSGTIQSMSAAAQPDIQILPGPTEQAEGTFGSRATIDLLSLSLVQIAEKICEHYGVEFNNPLITNRAMQAARCRKWSLIQMFKQEKLIHVAMKSREDVKTYEDAVSLRLSGLQADSKPIEESIDSLLARAQKIESEIVEFVKIRRPRLIKEGDPEVTTPGHPRLRRQRGASEKGA